MKNGILLFFSNYTMNCSVVNKTRKLHKPLPDSYMVFHLSSRQVKYLKLNSG